VLNDHRSFAPIWEFVKVKPTVVAAAKAAAFIVIVPQSLFSVTAVDLDVA
jgi:hypothetical protein